MSILEVEGLSHSYRDKILFNNASCRLLRGEHIGLVGINGSGKSTFLRILTKQLLPDKGRISWGKDIKWGYLEQHINFSPNDTIMDYLRNSFSKLFEIEKEYLEVAQQMGTAKSTELDSLANRFSHLQEILDHSDFYFLDIKIEEIAAGLGITAIGLNSCVSRLSGGQRTKLSLARLLLQKPDVLLLDEPTNYLDEEHITWLIGYLKAYEGAFILISHDDNFLDQVTTRIYHLDQQVITRYVGNHSKFLAAYELSKDQLAYAYKAQQAEIKKLETYIQKNKARASTAKMAKSREKKLERMEKIEKPTENLKPKFKFDIGATSYSLAMSTQDLVVGYTKPLLPPINLDIQFGDKVALVGYNGIGKSSSLKTFLGLLPPIKGSVQFGANILPAYFPQEDHWNSDKTALDEVLSSFPDLTPKEARGALARCGLTPKHIMQPIKTLSGGEQSKVRLCKLTLTKSNWLILDEPTNHLDNASQEALREALIAYKGTILLVSHDPSFYKGWISKVWNVESWIK